MSCFFAKTSPGNIALGKCPALIASVQMAILVGNTEELDLPAALLVCR